MRLIGFNKVNLLHSELVIKFIASEYFVKDRLVMAFKTMFFKKMII